ncbi:CgeB family protein [Amaricoccus solimangrovi]|uniref:Glycosyltransferase n=1 Tax=Amaricoccus solimangrovi TaxID=2589815 RepID=A0A501WPG4_9RHOB|nr:glycosyltransferase [Amaricoccus solimangrovi]TPE51653.1 glycosyltransferase [Amaricoccus solimangrovi]
MKRGLDIVFLGLSLSSSWGNGHATTYRALLRGLAKAGHEALFLERDMPWYATRRDLPAPDFCEFELYDDPAEVVARHAARIRSADAVIVGSYVPDGAEMIDRLAALGPRRLCFYDIDTPVTLAELARGERRYLTPQQMRAFDLYLSFSGGAVLDLLAARHGVRRPRALYCSVDAERYRPPAKRVVRWDLGYLGTYSPDRQPGLERLLLEPARRLPERRFVVAGAQFPPEIDWPANVERIEHVPPAEHPTFYGAQRFTLNLTRAAMRAAGWSPSVRLFEAGACGTPVISDCWPGLGDFFPDGSAIIRAESPEDVVRALERIGPERCRAIGGAARAIVTARDTGLARARDLAETIRATPPRAEQPHEAELASEGARS